MEKLNFFFDDHEGEFFIWDIEKERDVSIDGTSIRFRGYITNRKGEIFVERIAEKNIIGILKEGFVEVGEKAIYGNIVSLFQKEENIPNSFYSEVGKIMKEKEAPYLQKLEVWSMGRNTKEDMYEEWKTAPEFEGAIFYINGNFFLFREENFLLRNILEKDGVKNLVGILAWESERTWFLPSEKNYFLTLLLISE